MIDKFFKVNQKSYDMLSKNELRKYTLNIFFKIFIAGFVIFLALLFVGFNLINAFLILVGILVFDIYESVIAYKRDYIDDKYDLFSYKYTWLILIGIFLALIFAVFSIALIKSNIYHAIGFSSSMIFPVLFIFLNLNRNIYDVEIEYGSLVENEFGGSDYVVELGYFPLGYIILVCSMSYGPFGLALTRLLESILFDKYSFILYLIFVIIFIILDYLFLSPPILDKILPFELKTTKGFLKFCMISLIGMYILLFVMLFLG